MTARAAKRAEVVQALRDQPNRSAKALAAEVGMSQPCVSRIRRQVMQTHNLPDRVIGRDGRTYPALVARRRRR